MFLSDFIIVICSVCIVSYSAAEWEAAEALLMLRGGDRSECYATLSTVAVTDNIAKFGPEIAKKTLMEHQSGEKDVRATVLSGNKGQKSNFVPPAVDANYQL